MYDIDYDITQRGINMRFENKRICTGLDAIKEALKEYCREIEISSSLYVLFYTVQGLKRPLQISVILIL